MKKGFTCLLCLLFALFLLPSALAAESAADVAQFALPKPAAPVYVLFEAADRTSTEGNDALYVVRQTDLAVLALSAEENGDRDAFLQKYGLYDFRILMQYDTSLDGTSNWNYTPEWDSDYSSASSYEAAPIAWIGSDMMGKETVFDLYYKDPDNENYSKMAAAIIRRDVTDGDNTFHNFYFDWENHSLYIRCRYYMEWETYDGQNVGPKQTKCSQWSDVSIFGKGGTTVTPAAPTGYEAPTIANLTYQPPGQYSTYGSLLYDLATPQSVWEAGIYYAVTGSGGFDALETEISVNDGAWQPYETLDSWGMGALSAGRRTAYAEDPAVETNSLVKLRVRYVGTHGTSPWSNVITLTDGGTQDLPGATPANPGSSGVPSGKGNCGLCGFCPVPLGLCLFIWLAILLAVILLAVVLVLLLRPKKCRACGARLDKGERFCANCGAATGKKR